MRLGLVLAALSVAATAVLTLSWVGFSHYRETLWGEAARILKDGGRARVLDSFRGSSP